MLSEVKKKLARNLIDIGAIKFGSFRLKLHEKNPNAPLSPIYIDLRLLRSFPDSMDSAVAAYKELINGLSFDYFAGVPTAATPIVAILMHQTRIPMISPRLDKKGYGTSGKIDGSYHAGKTALLVDDLITRADSKLEAIAVLEENGIKVKDVVVLIDREQGGVAEIIRRGYACHCGFKLTELLNYYRSEGDISQGKYERTIKYIESN
ncbi:hypothetical protein KAR91_11170 [Candidatus Pacearchaeota archaeon]|nr:hypothetical protein [Candidatus Pacearchaeota archaeon]